MRLLIVPGDLRGSGQWQCDRATSRYLVRVLRLAEGDRFPARDEAGNRYRCTVRRADPDACLVGLESSADEEPVSPLPRICLVQALPKANKLDLIVRQAVEAGVSLVQPVQTSRSIAKITRQDGARDDRLRRIAREALQQSGSAIVTELGEPVDFGGLFAALGDAGFGPDRALRLFCHETPLAPETLHGYCARGPESVVIAVGPEGGFSPEECERFTEEGFGPLHFEGAVLRAETAALYAVAAVKTVLTEFDAWKAYP